MINQNTGNAIEITVDAEAHYTVIYKENINDSDRHFVKAMLFDGKRWSAFMERPIMREQRLCSTTIEQTDIFDTLNDALAALEMDLSLLIKRGIINPIDWKAPQKLNF